MDLEKLMIACHIFVSKLKTNFFYDFCDLSSLCDLYMVL